MIQSIGRELERVRKLRGLRREDVAAQLAEPVSPSTIRNIECDEDYNVSLSLLRSIASVLGVEVRVSLESAVEEAAGEMDHAPGDGCGQDRVVTDNEYFIRYIRSRYPDCPLTNSQIGRRMWNFAKPRGAEIVRGRKQMKRITLSGELADLRMPTAVVRYEVRERDFTTLEKFADRLGRAYRDEKGRVLVPVS